MRDPVHPVLHRLKVPVEPFDALFELRPVVHDASRRAPPSRRESYPPEFPFDLLEPILPPVLDPADLARFICHKLLLCHP